MAVVAANPQALLAPAAAVGSGLLPSAASAGGGGGGGPRGGASVLHAFFLALASWEDPPDDPQLLQQLGNMLGAVKAGNAGAWRAVLAVVDRDTAHRTLDTFRVTP